MHGGQRTLIKLLLQELHALDLFYNFHNNAIAEFMCLHLLLQNSRSYSETCIMARIHVEYVHEAHDFENGQMINLQSQNWQ